MISSIATCPGSGSSILMKNGSPVAQLLVTGELSHHDALAATEAGSAVITLFHSNSERGYLLQGMKPELQKVLDGEWRKVRAEMEENKNQGDIHGEAVERVLAEAEWSIEVSEVDRDPYQIKFWNGDTEL